MLCLGKYFFNVIYHPDITQNSQMISFGERQVFNRFKAASLETPFSPFIARPVQAALQGADIHSSVPVAIGQSWISIKPSSWFVHQSAHDNTIITQLLSDLNNYNRKAILLSPTPTEILLLFYIHLGSVVVLSLYTLLLLV